MKEKGNKRKAWQLLFVLLLLTGGMLKAQVPQDILTQKFDPVKERSELPGETMGQKLESSLYWSVSEEKRRFPNMYRLFPSTQISRADAVLELEDGAPLDPVWQDGSTLTAYMQENEVQGVLVLQDGQIRLEAYQNGFDQKTLWTSFSIAKSVSSMLLGAALKDGYLSMEDSLAAYIPVLKGEDYGKVTVEQLLTMTSGIKWNEDYTDPKSDVARMNLGACVSDESHILSYMKSLQAAHTPGTYWNYSTGEAGLLGILIQKATGMRLSDYLSEKIWKPWGMEHTAHWLADECSALNTGGHGISASLRDYGRIGMVMLHKGKKKEVDLFAKEWMEKATTPLQATNEEGGGYGYLWWVNPDGSYQAAGIFGQMLYVNPQKNLVIAQYAAWPQATSKELSVKRKGFIDAVVRAL